MPYLMSEQTWPQIQRAIENNTVLLLPLGQTEQHGLHLQTGCDTIIADQIAQAIAERLRDEPPVLIMPSIPYGYVPRSVQKWPGVFRIGWETMVRYVADVCVSAVEMGFEKLIVISTHGPHGDIARLAARDVFDRTGVPIVVSVPHNMIKTKYAQVRRSEMGGTSHAGEYETSLLMHFGYPVDLEGIDGRDTVKVVNEWVSGDMLNGVGRVSWSTWGLQVSDTGAYGDPSCATAQTGEMTFATIIDEYCRLVRFVHNQRLPQQDFERTSGTW